MPSNRSRQPQRTCIACRSTGDKRGLTRLVRTADGQVRLDPVGRLPGRGAYLCGQRQCWERALSRGDLLGRALRATFAPGDRDALLASAPAVSAGADTQLASPSAETAGGDTQLASAPAATAGADAQGGQP